MKAFKYCPLCGKDFAIKVIQNSINSLCPDTHFYQSLKLPHEMEQIQFLTAVVDSFFIRVDFEPSCVIIRKYDSFDLLFCKRIYWEPDFSDLNILRKRIETFLLLA